MIPAAFVGSIPVEIVTGGNNRLWLILLGGVADSWLIATIVFYTGLRRYESDNAINVNV